jgi:hypothetical protein
MIPFKGSRFGDLFLDRGWVNYVETFFFFWGIVILFMKWKKNQSHARAALLNLFPEHLGKEIHSGNVGAFIDNIYNVPLSLRDSLIVNRIRKALELFESRVNRACPRRINQDGVSPATDFKRDMEGFFASHVSNSRSIICFYEINSKPSNHADHNLPSLPPSSPT